MGGKRKDADEDSTPFHRFAQLAKKIITAPKSKAVQDSDGEEPPAS